MASKTSANLTTVPLERVLPHNMEAEQSLLGSMLLSHEAIPDAIDVGVTADDFYREAHGHIFNAITHLYATGEPSDPITVSEELKSLGVLEDVGGQLYLHTLMSVVPTAANARYYAQIVQRNALLRALIHVANQVASLAYESPEDVNAAVDRAESLIFQVAHKRISEKFVHIKGLLEESFEAIEKLNLENRRVTGLPTGFLDLDEKTAGLQPSDLIIIASRPGMGKTSLVLNIAQHVALTEKIPVAIFSLEMSRLQLAQRLMCSEARIDASALRTGSLRDDDWPKLSRAMGRLADAPILIDDTANITAMEIRAKARRLMAQYKLGLVVVDYLQLMQGERRSENRQQEISDISRSLKILGRELNIPIIAVSQLSRQVEHRERKRPVLADLRESGAIEQDADLVTFIYREEYYDKDSADKGVAELIIAKHRNGPTGEIRLAFMPQYTKFANLAKPT